MVVLVFQNEKKNYSLYINKHSFPGIVNTTHLQSQYLLGTQGRKTDYYKFEMNCSTVQVPGQPRIHNKILYSYTHTSPTYSPKENRNWK